MAGDPVIGHVSIYPYPWPQPFPGYWQGMPVTAPVMQYGWICPKCARVHAPSVHECLPCNEQAGKPPVITSDARVMEGDDHGT